MKSKAEEYLFVSDDDQNYLHEPKVLFKTSLSAEPKNLDDFVGIGYKRKGSFETFYESPICSSLLI
jgi:hypothetical protein